LQASLEGAWVDVANTHDKNGLCRSTAVFKVGQQCQLPHTMPSLFFCQDELVFYQFLPKSKNWTGPKGECALLPRSDGMAVIIKPIKLLSRLGWRKEKAKHLDATQARKKSFPKHNSTN
jgi:hypothetical protein